MTKPAQQNFEYEPMPPSTTPKSISNLDVVFTIVFAALVTALYVFGL